MRGARLAGTVVGVHSNWGMEWTRSTSWSK